MSSLYGPVISSDLCTEIVEDDIHCTEQPSVLSSPSLIIILVMSFTPS